MMNETFECKKCSRSIKKTDPTKGSTIIICYYCKAQYQWKYVDNKWNLRQRYISEMKSTIGKKKSFFKDMKDSFNDGYRQVIDKENQTTRGQVSKTEKINRIISEAELLTIDENFLDAWQKWDDVVTELDVMIRDTKLSRGLAKGAGWAGAIFTGGLGLEDAFIVPVVSKGLMKLFGVDLNFMLEKLEYALSKRHYCMDREPNIARISDFHSELAYFCWCYQITDRNNSQDKLKDLLSLINPFEDNETLKHRKSVLELYDLIEKVIIHGRNSDSMRRLNEYLYRYLNLSNKTNNSLFTKLKLLVGHV